MSGPLELWGGAECSCVRIGNAFRDELALTGHRRRSRDFERFASLGVRALRQAVLWEHHAGSQPDWRWADSALTALRELRIRPLVGLLHHGCGPLPGGFYNADFVPQFERYAGAVARRYPWVDAYIPVNEPNTTARFSGLYGVWHPHASDFAAYSRCLVAECLAIRAAMGAIRRVNPNAQLIVTEELGRVHSTPALAYQAEHENERRWFGFELLCGRAVPGTVCHSELSRGGIPAATLDDFVRNPCPPDVIGLNQYVTSERLLDERVERYPRERRGGNERDDYADVEAVRVRAEGLSGWENSLAEIWEHYRLPVAITEVQLDCTREEQVRWFAEAWHAALAARQRGINVLGVTAWALLGAYDWDSLLTRSTGHYESGAFAISGGKPRPTALARAIPVIVSGGPLQGPAAAAAGWWRRPVRLQYPPVSAPAGGGTALAADVPFATDAPPLLYATAEPAVAARIARLCHLRGLGATADAASNAPPRRAVLRFANSPALSPCIATVDYASEPALNAALDLLEDGETGEFSGGRVARTIGPS